MLQRVPCNMRDLLDLLGGCLKDGQIDKDERLAILNLISEINYQMTEVQIRKDDNSSGLKKFLAGCGTFLLTVLIVVASSGKGVKKA